MTNIRKNLIKSLKERHIFHCEADFQHHLAWHIHTGLQNADLRLEYPILKNNSSRREYCDIVLKSPRNIGIELKYKTKQTKPLVTIFEDECFELKNQGAQDHGRYDFLKDIQRLERWCEKGEIEFGYAIMLTNDHLYWNAPTKNTHDKNFRLHQEKITGILKWAEEAGAGTTKNREKPITLKTEYALNWENVNNSNDFKYLCLEVKC